MAPLYGTVSMQHLGFRWTNDIVALITLAFALVYLYAGGGWKAFGKTCRNRENEKNQRQVEEDGAEFRLFGAEELGHADEGEMNNFARD